MEIVQMVLNSPLFEGLKERSRMGDLSYFKSGDTAVLQERVRVGQQYIEKAQLVTITGVEPHQGQMVNGLTVAKDAVIDEVDLVSFQRHLGRDQVQVSNVVESMLHGEYLQGPQPGKEGVFISMHELDELGQPVAYNTANMTDTISNGPARIVRFFPVVDYINVAVAEHNRLVERLNQNLSRGFWARLKTLFIK
jgi:hypothetical protein